MGEDTLDIYSLYDLFKFSSGTFSLNGEEYVATERLSIGNGKVDIKASSINISTIVDNAFQYQRSVQMTIPTEKLSDADREALTEQIKSVSGSIDVSSDEEVTSFSFSFNAVDCEEIALKTMMALNVSDLITEESSYVNEQEMGISFSEIIDLSSMLDGLYSYSMEFPEVCHDFAAEDSENVLCHNGVVTTSDANGQVEFRYVRPFSFSKIQINTDISDIFGRIERTVHYYVPIDIAEEYHDIVKQELSETLVSGQVLNIYDDILYRNYEVAYSAWFVRQLAQMTQTQYNITDRDILHRPYFVFQSGSIRESIGHFTNSLSKLTGNIVYSVRYPSGVSMKGRGGSSNSDGTYSVSVTSGASRVSIRYTDCSLRVLIITGISFLIGLGALLFAIFKIKKGSDKNMNCPICKQEIKDNSKFCSKCGAKIPCGSTGGTMKQKKTIFLPVLAAVLGLFFMIGVGIIAYIAIRSGFPSGIEWPFGIRETIDEKSNMVDSDPNNESQTEASVATENTPDFEADDEEKKVTNSADEEGFYELEDEALDIFPSTTFTNKDKDESEENNPVVYFIMHCDTEYLTKNDLKGFNADMCRLARNGIYARLGRKFDDAELQKYFEQFDWYVPSINSDSFPESLLNDCQVANRDLIVAYEKEKGYRQ